MMKVTNKTFGMMVQNRQAKQPTVMLQKKLKSGKWGAAHDYELFGSEKTAEDVLERMMKNNPGTEYRIA